MARPEANEPNMTWAPPGKVYVIVDTDSLHGRTARDVLRAVLRGGASLVQYRAKDLSTREMVEEARALVLEARRSSVPLLINDRIDVALAVGADGAHVGQDDMPVDLARRMLGPRAILGVSAPARDLAMRAARDGASYVACGPMFSSPTKPGISPIGPEAIQSIKRAANLPVCAIGGITLANAQRVAEAGADLLAVVSAVMAAPDPEAATRELRTLVEEL